MILKPIAEEVKKIVTEVSTNVNNAVNPPETPSTPAVDIPIPNLIQKLCETCGKPAVTISKDRFAKRTCANGHSWYPSQKERS